MTAISNEGEKRGRLAPALCLGYLLLPFLVFAFGFLRLPWALTFSACVLLSYALALRKAPPMWTPTFDRKNAPKLALMGVLVLLTVLLSGIGGYVFQTFDHMARNQIFRLLVLRDWPLMANSAALSPDTTMVYYIGFWLPAAAVGKLFHSLEVGFFAQYLWGVCGIMALCYLLCAWRRKIAIWPCVVFFAFSGLDIVGAALTRWLPVFEREQELARTVQIEWWASHTLQFSSHLTMLFWVFNQSIPAWCAAMLLFLQRDRRVMVLILSTLVLTSALPFIGLAPIAVCLALTKPAGDDPLIRAAIPPRELPRAVGSLFTVPNVLGGGVIGIVSYLYLSCKDAGLAFSLNRYGQGGVSWMALGLFWLLEVGLYALLTWRYQRRNPLYWGALAMLAICPFIRFGDYYDFVMRVSIPSLMLLCLFVIDALSRDSAAKKRGWLAVTLIVLFLGAINPGIELDRTLYNTYETIVSGERFEREQWSEDAVLDNPVYTGSAKDNVFFDVFAKPVDIGE